MLLPQNATSSYSKPLQPEEITLASEINVSALHEAFKAKFDKMKQQSKINQQEWFEKVAQQFMYAYQVYSV